MRILNSDSPGLREHALPRLRMTYFLIAMTSILTIGCTKPVRSVQEVQRKRAEQQRGLAQIDYLQETSSLLSESAEFDVEAASQRITSLLNGWLDANPYSGQWSRPNLVTTLQSQYMEPTGYTSLDAQLFVPADFDHLKLSYLLSRISEWSENEKVEDSLFSDWIKQHETISSEEKIQLQRALGLFDWTIRNIALEPNELNDGAPVPPAFPVGLDYRGAGYRQTPLQTLLRGVGDGWQRSRVFIQLCRQANIDACVLATTCDGGASLTPWVTGVLIGKQLYLFDATLGLPIPGPGQEGIATLADARKDASVLRRMNVIGFFEYPFDYSSVQQCIALIDATPQVLSQRMSHLERGLTGETRMVLSINGDALAEKFDSVPGVAGARLWDAALNAILYEMVINQIARDNFEFAMWENFRWAMLSNRFPLLVARWDHLRGNFEGDEADPGARMRYMALREPEFQIDDLANNVEMQKQYNVRPMPGQTPEQYEMTIKNLQGAMRMAKRTASFWISLIHYDVGEFENAKNWYEKRVLADDQPSTWIPASRYNLARTLEQLGNQGQAVELYKTIGDPQEHGNRLRARLLERQTDES